MRIERGFWGILNRCILGNNGFRRTVQFAGFVGAIELYELILILTLANGKYSRFAELPC